MTIHDIVESLQWEKKNSVTSRFPCRAIMVKNIRQYRELLSELKKISDIRLVQMSELFTNSDIMPRYASLKNDKYKDEWLILTGVSEYLRLFAQNEAVDRRFSELWHYQAAASSKGRIIITLWGCEAQWFDQTLKLMSDERQKDFYYDCVDPDEDDQEMRLLVLSNDFEKHTAELETIYKNVAIGLRDWFEYWLDPSDDVGNFMLLTKRWNRVNTTNGTVSIHVIPDTLAFIRENMNGAASLISDDCTKEMQDILFKYSLNSIDIDKALLDILNVSSFYGIDIMSKWKVLSETRRGFVRMWFKLYPDNTYLCHCFADTENIAVVTKKIMLEIFKCRFDKPEWINEYRNLVRVMDLKPDERFFKELDAILDYETRLEFIGDTNRAGRIYILRMIGNWMREDRARVLSCAKLNTVYPKLVSYLDDSDLPIDDELKLYMLGYKSYKLENTLPVDENIFFNGIQTDIYDMRYSILSEYVDSDTFILWVDALGVEWLSLLNRSILLNCDAIPRKIAVVQASLPTETHFNEQWKVMNVPYEKLDKLDKLAHKGVIDVPDYYACIEEQIEFISGIHVKISELLNRYHRVIITGDHGTSRLAARFFHNRDGIDVPQNVKVYSHGRYCSVEPNAHFPMQNIRMVNAADRKQYAVLCSYDHFKQSGFAAGADDDNPIYGEIHGGAAPEEMLVPIIVLDSNREIPLSGTWEEATVKISMKKARFYINFNKPVTQLTVRINGINAVTACTVDTTRWIAVFSDIKQGTYTAQVYADNTVLDLPDVTVKPALGGGEGDLP